MAEVFRIECPGMMAIQNCEELKALFIEAADSSSDIEMDASAVEKIDTTAVQLILALKQKLDSGSHSLTWKGMSESVIKVVTLLGVIELLGISGDIQ